MKNFRIENDRNKKMFFNQNIWWLSKELFHLKDRFLKSCFVLKYLKYFSNKTINNSDGEPYSEPANIVKNGDIELENGLDINENEKNLTKVRNVINLKFITFCSANLSFEGYKL